MIRAAEIAAARWRVRVADHLRALRGIGVEISDDGVRASGSRLRSRWLTDARLRDLARWL